MGRTAGERYPGWIGQYEILRVLATSSRRDTLLARAHGPGGFRRTVLLRRYPSPRHERDANEIAREPRALALVTSPYIVQLYDFSRVEGRPLLVTEYVPGPSLAEASDTLRARGEPFPDEAIFHVGHALFSALHTAHHARAADAGELAPIVHRDVHPGNVRLSWTGEVKLAGFASAKVLELGQRADSTRPGLLRGTYGYMAPEQVLADAPSVAGDVYSAALVLYELLARRRAFEVGALPELEILKAMAYPSLPPLASIRPCLHPGLCGALDQALAPDPDARRVSASDLAAILATIVDLRWARRACVAALETMRADTSWIATPEVPRAVVSADLPADPDPTETFRFDDLPVSRSARPPADSLHAATTSTRPPAMVAIPLRRWAALVAATLASLAIVLVAVRPLSRAPRERAQEKEPVTRNRATSSMQASPRPSACAEPILPRPPATPTSATARLPAPPLTGKIVIPARARGHRVYVDGRVIGEGPHSFEVRCGQRLVRVGSAGFDQHIDVPCGGGVAVP